MNPAPARDPYAPGSRGAAPLAWPSNGPQAPPTHTPPLWNDATYAPPGATPQPPVLHDPWSSPPAMAASPQHPTAAPPLGAPPLAAPPLAAPPPAAPPPAAPTYPAPTYPAGPPPADPFAALSGARAAQAPPAPTDPWAGLNGGSGAYSDVPNRAPAVAAPALAPVAAATPAAPPPLVQGPPQAYAPHVPAHGAAHSPGHSRPAAEPARREREPGRRRTWLIALVAAVVVAAGATAAYFVFSGGSSKSPSQSAASDPGPTGTVSRFLTAVQKRDYDSAAAEVCAQTGVTAAQLGAVFDQQFADGIQSFEVEPAPAAEAGKPTLVQYTLTVKGQSSTYQASVTQRDGKACVTENRRLG